MIGMYSHINYDTAMKHQDRRASAQCFANISWVKPNVRAEKQIEGWESHVYPDL